MKISAVVITLNEEKNIARCLESVHAIADEIIVLDAFSTDRTEEIARQYNVRFIQRDWEDFSNSKNYANEQARYDYILSLDADEALSAELVENIRRIKQDEMMDGYFVNRRTNYCGRWIRHCGWYPDRKLRLWNRQKGSWQGAIHEMVVMQNGAQIGHLEGDLLHYAFDSITDHIITANKYSDIAARQAFEKGKKAGLIIDIILNPIATFIRKYFLLLGILDGYEGYIICRISAFANFLKYTKLRALWQKANR